MTEKIRTLLRRSSRRAQRWVVKTADASRVRQLPQLPDYDTLFDHDARPKPKILFAQSIEQALKRPLSI